MSYEQEQKKDEGSRAAGAAATVLGTDTVTPEGEVRHVPLPDVVVGATEAVANASSSAAMPAAATQAEAPGSEIIPGGDAPLDIAKTEQLLIDAMHTVFDPEIPVDIYELGLIYDLRITPQGEVDIKMTLTTPNCPVAGSMPGMVERVASMVEGVTKVNVELVWEPMWGPHMMTEAARLQLNMY